MNGPFFSRLLSSMGSLSKQERKAAEYIIDHRDELVCSSITQLAKSIGTSEATITRLSAKLGYSGFQMLKISAAREIVSEAEQIHEMLDHGDSADTIVEKVFSSAVKTLELTRRSLDTEAVARSIDVLCSCDQLVIIGCGNSGAIAMDAHHKFLRTGVNAHAYTDPHMQMIAICRMKKGDVLLAISHSGSSRDIEEGASFAKSMGATVISLTSCGISPVSEIADIRLHTNSQETRYRSYAIASRMAELTIIDALYTGVALRHSAEAVANFDLIEKSLSVKKY